MALDYGPNYKKLQEAALAGEGYKASKANREAYEAMTSSLVRDVRARRDKTIQQISSPKADEQARIQENLMERYNSVFVGGDTEVASLDEGSAFDTSGVVKVDAKNVEDFIAGLEKFRAKAYDDVDRLSIGYGTIASSKDEVITEPEARKRLKAGIKEAKAVVLKADKEHKYNFTSNQIDALTSFTYNAGQGNFSKLIDNGLRGIEEIADSIELYNKAGGKVLDGLVDRRKKEYALFTLGYK
jgi:lysozyme